MSLRINHSEIPTRSYILPNESNILDLTILSQILNILSVVRCVFSTRNVQTFTKALKRSKVPEKKYQKNASGFVIESD